MNQGYPIVPGLQTLRRRFQGNLIPVDADETASGQALNDLAGMSGSA